MTAEGLEEMFEGASADTCAGKFPLTSMGGQAEGLAYADPGAMTPIGVSGNFVFLSTGGIKNKTRTLSSTRVCQFQKWNINYVTCK